MIKQCHHDIQSSSHDTTHTEQKLKSKIESLAIELQSSVKMYHK